MKCTGLKAVSYPDTRMIIKGSTVKFGTNTRIFYIVCYSQLIINQMEIEKFNYDGSTKIEVNDGCIKCIYLEDHAININPCDFDKNGKLPLSDGGNAILEFENGKKMLITNSEWCSLNWL